MSKELVENVLVGNLSSANDLFEQKMNNIMEKKLYEKKRMVAAESNYSSYTQKSLQAGKRLLTPGEREGLKVDTSIKPGGTKHPTGIKTVDKSKTPDKAKRKAPPTSAAAAGEKAKAKRPGILKRNLNTLIGRKPGYVAPEKKPEDEGGRAGTAVRTAGKVAGKVAKGVFSLF